MQPIDGKKKEGALGVCKGIGKGIGGLALKPIAGKFFFEGRHWAPGIDHHCLGTWGLIGYTFEGVNKEMHKRFGSNAEIHIITSRKAQGFEEFRNATPEEKAMVIERWRSVGAVN
jgi:hypothetical protein